jgi:hypothetical protein
MKKVMMFLLAVLMVGMFYGANYYEHNYTREDCKVISVEDGVATIEDQQGWLWEAADDSLSVGDKVDLKMFDPCNSSRLSDDEITKIIKK